MDGNGRWAQRQGLPRRQGHRAGVENVTQIVKAAKAHDIRYLTLYAFSAENWNRPHEEVNLLMRLLREFLSQRSRELIENEIRFQVVGAVERLPREVRIALDRVIKQTAHFPRYTLTLALNYGSRQEVVHAIQSLLRSGVENPDSLSYEDLRAHLFTADLPDPDLLIRTSGEFRLSNFLLLQSAYSEFYFSDLCWPEFDPDELGNAIRHYRNRERRFGKTGEQVQGGLTSPLSGS